jgi:uncharacterized 2Fe-2S/4Fe-4S cluster protein (DUF4445 family)
MGKYEVNFLPDHKEIEVEKGITLLEAAEKAEVYINSLCGWQGSEITQTTYCIQCEGRR